MTKTLKEKLGTPLYHASIAFMVASGLDAISTSLCLRNGYRINNEGNDFVRYLMNQFGGDGGILAHNAFVIPAAIGLGYALNKSFASLFKDLPKPSIETGTVLTYMFDISRLLSSYNNFSLL